MLPSSCWLYHQLDHCQATVCHRPRLILLQLCLSQRQTVHPAWQYQSAASCFHAFGAGLPDLLLCPGALRVAAEYDSLTLSQRVEPDLAEQVPAHVLE